MLIQTKDAKSDYVVNPLVKGALTDFLTAWGYTPETACLFYEHINRKGISQLHIFALFEDGWRPVKLSEAHVNLYEMALEQEFRRRAVQIRENREHCPYIGRPKSPDQEILDVCCVAAENAYELAMEGDLYREEYGDAEFKLYPPLSEDVLR